ncbi:MAG: VOC family protein [Promethearchaeota archaeon]
MKAEHIAVASNSEADSDKFFIDLLGLRKTRSFTVSTDLMEQFFDIKKDQTIIRYENNEISFEVFITDDYSKAKDVFTHVCLIIEERDEFVNKSLSMGYTTIKVPRKDGVGYYLFIKDTYGNLYEIK